MVNNNGLTVVLRDNGRPINPASLPKPDLYPSLEDRNAGGLGFYLIHQLMDQVRFEFTPDSGNVLTMVKCKEAP